MSTLRLRGDLPERVDLLNITPLALSGLSEAEAGKLAIGTSRRGLTLGDVFEISLDGSDSLVIEGGSSRLDRVGAALSQGSIRVEGDVGQRLGEGMAAGTLTVTRAPPAPMPARVRPAARSRFKAMPATTRAAPSTPPRPGSTARRS
ncbi:formylmethanofuran dehydrogenase subunit C [Methylorubrum pseudosasae]|nr:formylmethanofuran dehydrogenase subunit C [Methylorubrum pseudosasae]